MTATKTELSYQKAKKEVEGIDPLCHFAFRYKEAAVLKTIFTQELLGRGFLASNGYYASFAHKESHIGSYARAVNQAFEVVAKAIASERPADFLAGEVAHSGFRRLTY